MIGDDLVLLLWADAGVGKTSLLAAGLLSEERRMGEVLDMAASRAVIDREIRPLWLKLKSNVATPPTSVDMRDLTLTLRSGRRLIIRDIDGALTRKAGAEEYKKALEGVDGILFMVEWLAPDPVRQFTAIESVLSYSEHLLKGLAFTKCEGELVKGETESWRIEPATGCGSRGWWKRPGAWSGAQARTLDRFEATWPTSVYGFHHDGGLPACVLDEFGGVIPFEIAPINAADVFFWFFREFDR